MSIPSRTCRAFVMAVVAVALATPAAAALPVQSALIFATVTSVSDTMTLTLDTRRRVRLIGVDGFTSESAEEQAVLQKESATYLRKLVEGRRVWLEFDKVRDDGKGNTLAYVYRTEDSMFVNAELIKKGYAVAYLKEPFRHIAHFKKLDADARLVTPGLWRKQPPAQPQAFSAELKDSKVPELTGFEPQIPIPPDGTMIRLSEEEYRRYGDTLTADEYRDLSRRRRKLASGNP